MLTDKERAAILWNRTAFTQPPLKAPPIRMPKGFLKFLIIALLFPILIPLFVLVSVTYTAITRRTNKY